MKLVIEINTDNSAFDEYPHLETMRILQNYVRQIGDRECIPSGTMRDINGNTVGKVNVYNN